MNYPMPGYPMGMDQNEQLAYGRPFLRRPMQTGGQMPAYPVPPQMTGGALPPMQQPGMNMGGALPPQMMGPDMGVHRPHGGTKPMDAMPMGGPMPPMRLARMAGRQMGYGNRLGGLVR